MAKRKLKKRLARQFHKTFKPERRYIREMMKFASLGQQAEIREIAEATGIPTGKSSGKAPAILDYCIGMGLISLKPANFRNKNLELTDFGRAVFQNDPFLKTEVSQWIAHFNLCGLSGGADVWHQTFFAHSMTLGSSFRKSSLEDMLSINYGVSKKSLAGPMIGTYEDDAAFKTCGALSESNGIINRKKAPIKEEMIFGYGAWILDLMAVFFPEQQQVSVTELDAEAGWKIIPGWSNSESVQVLENLERKDILIVDRQMNPWLMQPKKSSAEVWQSIYKDLL